MRKHAISILFAAGLTLVFGAAGIEPRWRALNEAANKAIKADDYRTLRKTLLELKPLMPGNPRIAYNLAASNAKLGNPAAAFTGLRNLAAMGLFYDLKADADFASIRESKEFAAVLARMDANRKPVSHSVPVFAISQPDLLPEDIAYDSKTRRFFISSVRKSKIVTGDGKDFARAPWSVLALAIDANRRILWATTAWVPHCESCAPGDKDKTALLAFDLDTGALKRRIDSPWKGLLGDMTIARSGDIYVSEGIYGAVLHLPPGGKQLERIDAEGEFPSPQTPALSPDEKTLYVPDYARGIGAIDLATRRVQWLQPADDIALSGIDGLYVYRGSFIAVQNGTAPARVIRFSPDLRKQRVLEANTPGLGEPTHGTLIDDAFYFIANTGWSAYGPDGKKKTGTPVHSAVWKTTLAN